MNDDTIVAAISFFFILPNIILIIIIIILMSHFRERSAHTHARAREYGANQGTRVRPKKNRSFWTAKNKSIQSHKKKKECMHVCMYACTHETNMPLPSFLHYKHIHAMISIYIYIQ